MASFAYLYSELKVVRSNWYIWKYWDYSLSFELSLTYLWFG